MTDLPLVSIVTPSYNQGQFIEETILSVLRQDYPNIEYIIIDGGSTDGSVDIIRKYEDKLAYWVSEKDQGQTHAINKGFAKARGSVMNWLCSDDILEPSMVSISMHYLLKYPNIGVTYGDRVRIDAKGNIYGLQRYPAFKPYLLRWGFQIPQETVLFRREIFDAVGGLDESLKMAMDFDLWCKIGQVSSILHIPAVIGRFRAHATNKSSVFTKQLQKEGFAEGNPAEYAKVYEKHFDRKPSCVWGNLAKLVWQFQSLVERRTNHYHNELATTESIRLT